MENLAIFNKIDNFPKNSDLEKLSPFVAASPPLSLFRGEEGKVGVANPQVCSPLSSFAVVVVSCLQVSESPDRLIGKGLAPDAPYRLIGKVSAPGPPFRLRGKVSAPDPGLSVSRFT